MSAKDGLLQFLQDNLQEILNEVAQTTLKLSNSRRGIETTKDKDLIASLEAEQAMLLQEQLLLNMNLHALLRQW